MFTNELLAAVEIIFDPAEILKRAIKLKKYWIPIAIILVVSSAFTIYTAPIQHADQVQFIKNNPKIIQRMSPEQIEKMKEYNPKTFIARVLITLIIMIPLSILFLAAFINWFAQLAEIEISYLVALTITSYASYIDYLWGSIAKNIFALIKGSYFSVSTSLALFVPGLEYTSKTYKILSSFDFFNIWSYILIALGISLLPNGTIKKGAIIAGAIFVIKIIIIIGFSMIF
jgi:hypothetical protein